MFDIGFLEIFVILIIALLVIGPKRMPEVARKLGSFMGKTRNFINKMKDESPLQDTVQEVKSAMNLEEEKRQMTNITKELEEGLNFNDTDISLDDFQRPFGGDSAESGSSQFNKAPSQPKLPEEKQTSNTNNVETEQTTTVSEEAQTAETSKPVEKSSESSEQTSAPNSETQKS